MKDVLKDLRNITSTGRVITSTGVVKCETSRITLKGHADPYCGHLFVFRGRRGDLIKVIWWDGQGACLFSKRLERGRLFCNLLRAMFVSD